MVKKKATSRIVLVVILIVFIISFFIDFSIRNNTLIYQRALEYLQNTTMQTAELIGKNLENMAGEYQEEQMREILGTMLFGEAVPSLLCLADGSVVSDAGWDEDKENGFSYLEGMISPEEEERLRQAMSNREDCDFTYVTELGEACGYMTPIEDTDWMLIQLFPVHALSGMRGQTNRVGMALEIKLIAVALAFIAYLLVQTRRENARLAREKSRIERVVEGVNKLFSRFIVVDFEADSYQYLESSERGFKSLPVEGKYSEFLDNFENSFSDKRSIRHMENVLSVAGIQESLTKDVPYQRYEYQIKRGEEDVWETIAIIALEWKEGKVSSVLLAIQDTTELKKAEFRTQGALMEAYQEAEAANAAKSDFLSRMSHDIRTPMNAIMGMTTVAFMHIDDKARVEDCLNKINSAGKHLLGLINEVLDMSKIESGKMELREEVFSLSDMIEEILGILHPQIEGKKQTLSVVADGDLHEMVEGDSQRLSQVLVNIVGNAVKYTPEGGHISFRISELPSRLKGSGCYEFVVVDNGIGMDEEFCKKVFEPFTREKDSRVGNLEGTGLGMTIASSIIRMMNGNIQVQSEKGKGTEITVTVFLRHIQDEGEQSEILSGNKVMVLDDDENDREKVCRTLRSLHMTYDSFVNGNEALAALEKDRSGEQAYKAVITGWKMEHRDGLEIAREIRKNISMDIPIILVTAYDWSAIERDASDAGINGFIAKPLFRSRLVYELKKALGYQHEEEVKAFVPQKDEFAGKKILVVEDNDLNMEIAKELLTMAGFELDEARNGREAVDKLLEMPPDTYRLVLMDIQMPVMNGYEAAAIRASGRGDLEKLPIIAMTADAFSEDIKKAAAAGMNGHIAKPIDVPKLIEMMEEWA